MFLADAFIRHWIHFKVDKALDKFFRSRQSLRKFLKEWINILMT